MLPDPVFACQITVLTWSYSAMRMKTQFSRDRREALLWVAGSRIHISSFGEPERIGNEREKLFVIDR